jgi:16S rRNA G966 N2-methylase RsmD
MELIKHDPESEKMLANMDQASYALGQARSIAEIKHVHDIAEAAKRYVKAADLCNEAYVMASVVAADARRKAGEMLMNLQKSKGGRPNNNLSELGQVSEYAEVLKEVSLPRQTAHKWQEEARIPDDIYQEIKSEALNKGKELSQNHVLNVKKEIDKKSAEFAMREAVDSIKDKDNGLVTDIQQGWHKVGDQYLYYGSNLDKQFLAKLPKCKFAFADPPYNAGVDEWDKNFTWSQDYLQDYADVVAVTPGGWDAYNFYHNTMMIYQWEMACWIRNGMTHGRCGYANWIKVSLFGKTKPNMSQDFFDITIKTNETEDTKHKGRKPYDFMGHLIATFTDLGDSIIDPFAGSGTTLLMSEKLGRISYNAEMDKQYCIDIINRSIANGMKYASI